MTETGEPGKNQPVSSNRGEAQTATGVVEWFDADEGWGAITSPQTPGGCFVHFSAIQMDGFRELHSGQGVRFTYSELAQDGYSYRAETVWPQG
jgi:CspA family cold shock protein